VTTAQRATSAAALLVGVGLFGVEPFGAAPAASQTSQSVVWPEVAPVDLFLQDGIDARPHQEVTAAPDKGGLTFLGTAKWASLAISAGAAAYGFSLNSQADDVYDRLDAVCLEDPDRCKHRNPDGSFADGSLESLYQETLSTDRQARTALVVSQVALAASVLFFIMDLSNKSPPNIPYDPAIALEAGPTAGGRYSIGARVRVGH